MKQQDVRKAQRDEAEKKNRSPSLGSARDRPARQGQPLARRYWNSTRIPCGEFCDLHRIRATTAARYSVHPLFSLDVQLADQSRAEKTRSKSLDLTNHLPLRLSTMNWIGAVI